MRNSLILAALLTLCTAGAARADAVVAHAETSDALRHAAAAAQATSLAEIHAEVAAALRSLEPVALPALDRAAAVRSAAVRAPETSVDEAAAALPVLAATQGARVHLRAAMLLGEHALAAEEPVSARRKAEAMRRALDTALRGEDRNGDGRVTLAHGEAGLDQLAAASNGGQRLD